MRSTSNCLKVRVQKKFCIQLDVEKKKKKLQNTQNSSKRYYSYSFRVEILITIYNKSNITNVHQLLISPYISVYVCISTTGIYINLNWYDISFDLWEWFELIRLLLHNFCQIGLAFSYWNNYRILEKLSLLIQKLNRSHF